MGYKTFFTKTFNHLVIEDGRVDARDRLKEKLYIDKNILRTLQN